MRSRFIGALFVLGASVWALPAYAESALDRLRQLFKSELSLPAGVFVQVYRQPNSQSVQKLTIQIDELGRSMWTVIEPLSQQGGRTFVDSEKMIAYDLDQKTMMVVPNNAIPRTDPDRRAKLVEKNYRLAMVKDKAVAGRPAFRITAEPRAKDMPKRILWLDQQEPSLLRYEIQISPKQSTILVDTLSVSYGASHVDFDWPKTEGWQKVESWGPKALGTSTQVRTLAGISPVLPKELPMGFEILSVTLGGQSVEKTYLVVRISDGLATATVYQCSPRVAFRIPDNISGAKVRYYLVGDLGSAVKQKLLSAFAKAEPFSANAQPK